MNMWSFNRRRNSVLQVVLSLFIGAALIAGCEKKNSELSEVTGNVTFCGQAAIAEVLFEPVGKSGQSSGRASSATTNERGEFRLMLDDSQAGARISQHRVTIRVQRLTHPAATKVADTSTSEGMIGALKVTHMLREVQANSNHFSFRLTP